jgi:dimethylargininase
MAGWIAITREISADMGRCELTHIPRQSIDLDLARLQHRLYEQCLAELECRVVRLPATPDMADSVFVEDTCVVFDELAVIARPGAISRRGETDSVAGCLKDYRPLVRIEPPGTLDGGDVLVLGRSVYIGQSTRTNADAINQMQSFLEPRGYLVYPLVVHECLHLKSAACPVADGVILLNPGWVDAGSLSHATAIPVDPDEPAAANALRIGNTIIFPSSYPKTAAKLRSQGIGMKTVDLSELAKAEGAVTCCSVVFHEWTSG